MLKEGSRVLSDAIGAGLIDTRIDALKEPAVRRSMQMIEREGPQALSAKNPNELELLNHPRTERWQEHVYPPLAHGDQSEWYCLELARIKVPKGEIGILRSLEQVMYDVEGNYYATQVDYWGSPYSVQPDVDNVRWWLQLDYLDQLDPARFAIQQPVVFGRGRLPGYPYSELNEIHGLWYPALSGNTSVKFVIPGHRMLRFFVWTPPTINYRWTFAGRLRATLQTTYCSEALQNTRLGF